MNEMTTRVIVLVVLAIHAPTSSGWTDKVRLFDDYAGGEGNSRTPLVEKDMAYLFCSSDRKADRAVSGDIDWARTSRSEYCRYKHRNDPNSLRNGWRRDRLKAGCRAQLNSFANKVFRCWDYRSDTDLGDLERRYNEFKQREYEVWQEDYRDRLRIVLENVEPEIRTLNNKIDGNNATKTRLDGETARLKELRKKYMFKIGDFSHFHDLFVQQMERRLSEYQELEETLRTKLSYDADDLETIAKWVDGLTSEIMRPDFGSPVEVNIREKLDEYDHSCQIRVCTESRTKRALEALRAHQAVTNSLFEAYIRRLEALILPTVFHAAASKLDTMKSKMEALQDRFSIAFGEEAQVLTETPHICDAYRTLPFMLSARNYVARVNDQADTAADVAEAMRSAMAKNEAHQTSTLAVQEAKIALRSVGAKISALVQRGELAAAWALRAQSDASVARILAASRENTYLSDGQLSEIKEEAERTAASVAASTRDYLSLSGAKLLNKRRLRRLENTLEELNDGIGEGDPRHLVWTTVVRPAIAKLFASQDLLEIDPPSIRSVHDAVAFDNTLSRAFEVLDLLNLE